MAGGIGNYALFSGGPFRIATLVPDVVIEAVGMDVLGITGYPCEDGVVRADHSVKLPARVEMVAGWSNSSAGYNGYIQEIYRKLLSIQAQRQPFNISTSRRIYRNMLLESLIDPIGARTYSAMVARITFRELQISRTKTSSSGSSVATDPTKQADPASTGGTTDRGTVSGLNVSPQSFAGSFNPGNYSPDGGTVGNGSFGLNPPSADLTPNPITLPGNGFAAPTLPTPDFSIPPIQGIGGLQGAGPDQYNMFGGGP